MAAGVVTITYSLTGAAGCYSTRTLTVTPLAALRPRATNTEGNTMNIYPNPNGGTFTISGMLQEKGEVQIVVTNLVGQVVYDNHATINEKILHEQVQLGTSMPPGIYLLILRTLNEQLVFRIVVE
jgi:hypothetical protein